MTVQELAAALEAETAAAASHAPSGEGDDFESDTQFVDVREEGEAAVAALPHFRFMPLSHFGEWSPLIKDILDPAKETVSGSACLSEGVMACPPAYLPVLIAAAAPVLRRSCCATTACAACRWRPSSWRPGLGG